MLEKHKNTLNFVRPPNINLIKLNTYRKNWGENYRKIIKNKFLAHILFLVTQNK